MKETAIICLSVLVVVLLGAGIYIGYHVHLTGMCKATIAFNQDNAQQEIATWLPEFETPTPGRKPTVRP